MAIGPAKANADGLHSFQPYRSALAELIANCYLLIAFYAAAAGGIDRRAAWWINFFITVAHMIRFRRALSFTTRPWANIPSKAFILNTRRRARSDAPAPYASRKLS